MRSALLLIRRLVAPLRVFLLHTLLAFACYAAAAQQALLLENVNGVNLANAAPWREAWEADRNGLTDAARAVQRLDAQDRGKIKAELDATKGQQKFQAARQNLDIGRHDLLKHLLKLTVREANRRLEQRKLAPLDRVLTVNSGGYGDFGRDQDITAFAGDDLRERVFFEAMRDVAVNELHVRAEWQDGPSGARSGVTLPGLEVTFHRGGNELPDTVSTKELQSFSLDYRKVIEQQAKMPEAYFGYGAETEVQASRVAAGQTPGRTRLQIFRPQNGQITCTSVFGATPEQVRSETSYRGGSRVRRAQQAVHIVNDLVQASHHRLDAASSVSQGPLKYAGRALEQLCQFSGRRSWAELAPEDRVELLRPLFPNRTPDEAAKLAVAMGKYLDIASETFRNKAVPKTLGGRPAEANDIDTAARGAMIFLKNAAAHAATSIAQEMICPPPFDYALLESLTAGQGRRFADLSYDEQVKLALKHDRLFQEHVSVAAMENLLVTMRALREVQALAPELAGDATGKLLRQARIEGLPDDQQPPLPRVLQLAADHAELSLQREASRDPSERRALAQRIDRLRYEISQRAAAFQGVRPTLTGAELLSRLQKAEPRRTVQAFTQKNLPPEIAALEEHRRQLTRLALPADDPSGTPPAEAVKSWLKMKGGLGSSATERFYEEACQLGNVATALQLVELYQNGAEIGDYASMLGLDLAGRYRWYLGYVGQAALAKDMKSFEDLGKNIVFDAAARYVPGVGTFKLAIDIEKGLVNVTVGYTFNQLNAALIDAVYTGEAGRLNDGTAGKRAGAIRDANISVLGREQVRRLTDTKAKQERIQIEHQLVYRDFFKQWTGIACDDVFTRSAKITGGAELVAAHDAVIALLRRQAAEQEPLWPGDRSESFNPKDLEDALAKLRQTLVPLAGKLCQERLSQLAVREFFVKDEDGVPRDQIFEGLKARLIGDFMAGLFESAQQSILEQAVIKRRLEGLADAGDIAALASELSREIVKPLPSKASYRIAILNGLGRPEAEMDGTAKLPIQVEVSSRGGPAATVKIELTPGVPEPVDANYRPAGLIMGGETTPRAGPVDTEAYWRNVVRQPVDARALVNGQEVARTSRSFFVRLKKWTAAQPAQKAIKFEDIALPKSAWPAVFYSGEARRRSISRLDRFQPLDNWELEAGRSVGWSARAKEVYNIRVLGGQPGQPVTPDDIKINDEQVLDMSWVLEKADGRATHIDVPNLATPDQATNADDVSRTVALSAKTKGRLSYVIRRFSGGAPSGFDGTLVFLVDNVRGKIRLRSKTSSADGRSGPVNDATMPELMSNLAKALVATLESGSVPLAR